VSFSLSLYIYTFIYSYTHISKQAGPIILSCFLKLAVHVTLLRCSASTEIAVSGVSHICMAQDCSLSSWVFQPGYISLGTSAQVPIESPGFPDCSL